MTTLTPRQAIENHGLPNRMYLASEVHRLVCCAIPKNGCTTVKKWFLSFADPAGLGAPDAHEYCAPRWVISLWEGPARDRAFETFFCFAFLRDPLSRAVSAYIEKFVGGHPYGYFEPARDAIEDIARLGGVDVAMDRTHKIEWGTESREVASSSAVDYERGVTFREFANYLCEAPDDHLDVHWRSQSSLLAGRRMDFLGRVSSMTGALAAISAARGYPPPPPMEQGERATSVGEFLGDTTSAEVYHRFLYSRGVLPPAEAFFDEEIRVRLRERFAADAELYQRATDLPASVPRLSGPPPELNVTIPASGEIALLADPRT